MRKILLILVIFQFTACAELQQVVNTFPQGDIGLSNADIAAGLRQALDNGIDKQVSKLTKTDGFYRNELVKILLPQELQKVDKTLRDIGLGNLADEGLRVLNRAAEDAVKEATPIFVNAVRQITFTDAKNILVGADNAATQYLSNKTTNELYGRFNPVISNSLDKVGATQVWNNIITQYNAIPLTANVNPDLADYVTQEALKGVFNMIAVEEKEIRNNFAARTTDLLRRVFALQDK
ncbi:MAG: DUF4197 domain-containing protein [Flavobacteriales bacterium]|nr:DUF4197 domain-containing protein [Flavobacteriales bacterium]